MRFNCVTVMYACIGIESGAAWRNVCNAVFKMKMHFQFDGAKSQISQKCNTNVHAAA